MEAEDLCNLFLLLLVGSHLAVVNMEPFYFYSAAVCQQFLLYIWGFLLLADQWNCPTVSSARLLSATCLCFQPLDHHELFGVKADPIAHRWTKELPPDLLMDRLDS